MYKACSRRCLPAGNRQILDFATFVSRRVLSVFADVRKEQRRCGVIALLLLCVICILSNVRFRRHLFFHDIYVFVPIQRRSEKLWRKEQYVYL